MRPRRRLVLAVAASVVLPALAFVLLGDRFEAGVADAVRSMSGGRLLVCVTGLLAGDLLLPIPSSVVLTFAGRELGAAAAFGAGMVGLTASCELGYWAARVLRRREPSPDERLLQDRMTGSAVWWLQLTRPLPILAEASTLVAGWTRVPHTRFLVAVLTGNAWVVGSFVAMGVLLSDWPAAAVLALSAVVPVAVTLLVRRLLRRDEPPP